MTMLAESMVKMCRIAYDQKLILLSSYDCKILESLEQGKNYNEIAMELNISKSRVSQIMEAIALKTIKQFRGMAQKIAFLESPEKELCSTEFTALNLSVRTERCLKRNGIKTIDDLLSLGDEGLMHIRNIGLKGYKEIKNALKKYSLELKKNV